MSLNLQKTSPTIGQKCPSMLYSTRAGTSLLMSLGIVFIIGILSVGISSMVVSSTRQSANVNAANQAYYAAEGGLELGLLDNLEKGGAGFTQTPIEKIFKPAGLHGSAITTNYQITGQVEADKIYALSNEYGVPRPGTGDVGKDCDSTNPFLNTFWYKITGNQIEYRTINPNDQSFSSSIDAKEHPCNWSKISLGQSDVSIPLYVTTTTPIAGKCTQEPNSPLYICNPVDTGLTFILRIRPPCTTSTEYCPASDRILLDYQNGSDLANSGNNTLLDWQITASNFKGDTYSLLPNRELEIDPDINPCKDIYSKRCILPKGYNSEITASLINFFDPNFNLLSSINYRGYDFFNGNLNIGKIDDFLKNSGIKWIIAGPSSLRWNNNYAITKPILKLKVISPLFDHDLNSVPYLEYQLLVKSSIPPTNSSQIVKSEGFSGNFKQVLQVSNPQESGILEYVIQQ